MMWLTSILLLYVTSAQAEQNQEYLPKKTPIELLAPVDSTTAMMCEPVLVEGKNRMATWYRDGEALGNVTSKTNLELNKIVKDHDEVPQLGFLVIGHVKKENSGMFWCEEDETGKKGTVYKLAVGYIDPLPESGVITHEPSVPFIGHSFYFHATVPQANPLPRISWFINGNCISHTFFDYRIFPNGTLYIPHFSPYLFGKIEFVASNFVGNTSTSFSFDVPIGTIQELQSHTYEEQLRAYMKSYPLSKKLWALCAILAALVSVLLYVLFTVDSELCRHIICYHFYPIRTKVAPTLDTARRVSSDREPFV